MNPFGRFRVKDGKSPCNLPELKWARDFVSIEQFHLMGVNMG